MVLSRSCRSLVWKLRLAKPCSLDRIHSGSAAPRSQLRRSLHGMFRGHTSTTVAKKLHQQTNGQLLVTYYHIGASENSIHRLSLFSKVFTLVIHWLESVLAHEDGALFRRTCGHHCWLPPFSRPSQHLSLSLVLPKSSSTQQSLA
jgi:hypothetical protein